MNTTEELNKNEGCREGCSMLLVPSSPVNAYEVLWRQQHSVCSLNVWKTLQRFSESAFPHWGVLPPDMDRRQPLETVAIRVWWKVKVRGMASYGKKAVWRKYGAQSVKAGSQKRRKTSRKRTLRGGKPKRGQNADRYRECDFLIEKKSKSVCL
jgi:hypothetical protein